MSTPFTSKLFENSTNNADGWDEWDWVDNNNISNVTKSQQQLQITLQPVQTGFSGQNVQVDASSNNQSNYHHSIEPTQSPTLDHASNSFSSSEQPTTLPNYDRINTSIVNNNQGTDNNFMQTSSQHIQNSPNSVGIIQLDGPENYSNPLVRTPSIEYPSGDSNPQNVLIGINSENSMAKILDTQVLSSAADTTTLEATSEPGGVPVLTSVFNNNVVENNKGKPLSSLNLSTFANTNPFKRVGSHAHKTSPVLNTSFFNSIHPKAEISRNEYLQTGQLTTDNNDSTQQMQFSTNEAFESESMPPPFESRFVLGENQSKINMEREGDGASSQDNVALSVMQTPSNASNPISRNSNQFSSVQKNLSASHKVVSQSFECQNIESFEPIPETDRSQLVAGENVDNIKAVASAQLISNVNIQRVVTGLENVQKQDISLPKLREIDLDGAEDQQQIQQQQQQQEQPHQQSQVPAQGTQQSVQHQTTQQIPHLHSVKQVGLHAVYQGDVKNKDSVEKSHCEDVDTSDNYNRKIQPNPSNKFDQIEFDSDDTDRGKTYSKRNKRITERRKKRDDFFDDDENITEHSIRGKRCPKENDRYSEKERGHRDGSVEIDDNLYRRGENSHAYRPPSRDDEDRYEGRYR